jgi:hypothetical protein
MKIVGTTGRMERTQVGRRSGIAWTCGRKWICPALGAEGLAGELALGGKPVDVI